MHGCTSHMTKSLNTLSSWFNGNNPEIMEGDAVRWRSGWWAMTRSITCAWLQLKDTYALGSTPRHKYVHTRTWITPTKPSRTAKKCSIHLDLSIATILITPESCQPAKLGGEYWFTATNRLIAVFKSHSFPSDSIFMPFSSFSLLVYRVCRSTVWSKARWL